MFQNKVKCSIVLLVLCVQFVVSQNTVMLTKEEAVQEVLEKNFGIEIANNNLTIADNNRKFLNSGYLPSLTGLAGANYDIQDQEATFQDGRENTVNDAETTRYNASINLDYTLFDGLGRYWNYKALNEQYGIEELQVRQTIETTMLQLFSVYYEKGINLHDIKAFKRTVLRFHQVSAM